MQDPTSLVPVHARDFRGYRAGSVMWSTLGLWITDGISSHVFVGGRNSERHQMRQGMVQRLVDAGRVRPITAKEGRAALGDIPRHVRARNRRPKELGAQVRAWLASPSVRSPHRPLGQSCD
ncbi:hypothetical protein ACFT8Q_21580 [Streptomyces griseoincarnatus]